ncbi:LysM peptidoglycan-binding domain-containing protein [Jannaschia ovalis]|uniref:LysM peptidoglycan-binding domain-containing protein n=1 Tax=Jannaschia ovalis TaxID=3038773 RepID=A0ABY8LER6_9RHOB|nr:LysM peptidoglycan-binding domain-containing protein [Jannaschia sp. GRR-S6-38]WGH78658.1 LysM peptidoglycan-binding domain-containing protein [Jannaschia sp. GRR-S6-38]
MAAIGNAALGGLAAAVAVAVAVGGYAIWSARDGAEPRVAEPSTTQPAPTTPSQAAPQPASDPEPEAQADAAEAPEPTPAPPEPRDLPSLDVVRVERDGRTLVAGRGPSDGDVTLRLDGETVATARADRSGNFVAFLDLPPAEAPRLLTLEAADATGTVRQAAGGVIVAPTFPARPAPGTAPELQTATADPAAPGAPAATGETADPAPVAAGQGGAAATDPAPAAPPATTASATDTSPAAPATPPAGTAETAAAPTEAAPRLFRAGPEGIAVLPGAAEAPEVTQSLGIDVIAYDAQGEVQLAGTAGAAAELRIYLDNRPVRSVTAGSGGAWASPLPDVEEGVYTLRIDALDAAGRVASRIETPFERTAPELAVAVRADGAAAITVQPGFTLWAISESWFGAGEGIRYVQIFEANRDLIRDPDLIYPGQVFALPDSAEDAAGD